ncbi:MAG TPA: glycoside hydrolase family 125 protein [Candidatus Cryosericum sp.]|nr:glycoside hydrolase family 125 protein [Candidatus Cryosericum sp.]
MKQQYLVTGNAVVSLPTIRQSDAAIEGISFLHMSAKGMIELCGDEADPLLKPFVNVNGGELPLTELRWTRRLDWIPEFTARAGDFVLEGTILAPTGERGFGVRLRLTNEGEAASAAFGLNGCWAVSKHTINESKPVTGERHVYHSGWNHSFVLDQRAGFSLFAFAPIVTETPETCPIKGSFLKKGERVSFTLVREEALEPKQTLESVFWFGLGFEEVAAATSAKEMLRRGFNAELEKTTSWLQARRRTVGDAALDELLNTNLLFSYFFGGGVTLDSEEYVLVTSRSPRYYVSAAYWDRDSLLWSFPAILLIDPPTAREMLLYVFTRQKRNIGVHSRFIDGTLLEPGFELDELCAPVIALKRYIDATNDTALLQKDCVLEGIDHILRLLRAMRHEKIALYETFLQPTDDLIEHPYLTYDNVLVWYSLNALAEMYASVWPKERLSALTEEAERVKRAIWEHCVFQKDGEKIFAWSVDLCGKWNIYDEPPGSLLLLPYYGFCGEDDPVWQASARTIRRADYPYSFADCPIAEIGCPHAPYPWVLSISNSLLSGRREAAKQHLMKTRMDNGVACESVDPYTGECRTGEAFATCAGFLAYAIDEAFGGKRVQNDTPSNR